MNKNNKNYNGILKWQEIKEAIGIDELTYRDHELTGPNGIVWLTMGKINSIYSRTIRACCFNSRKIISCS